MSPSSRRAIEEHVPRGEKRQRERRGLDERQVRGDRNEIRLRHPHVFRVAAVGLIAEHVVLRAPVVAPRETARAPSAAEPGLHHDTQAAPDDFARDIGAGNVRQRNRHAVETAPLPQIEVIERARAHADDRVPRQFGRVGRVFVDEHFRPAVLMKPDGLHLSSRKALDMTW